jgi:hypothetical protein
MISISDNNSWLPWEAQKFTHSDSGLSVRAPTVPLIIKHITAAMNGINYPVPHDIDQQVLESVCRLAPHACKYTEGSRPQEITIKKGYTVSDVKAFLKAVEGTIKSGGVVDQETAEERTNICMKCPYNQKLPGCEGCSGIANLVFSVIGGRKTKNMGELKQCGVCGCSLRAKVWVPQETIKQTAQIQNNSADFPDWCWVRK